MFYNNRGNKEIYITMSKILLIIIFITCLKMRLIKLHTPTKTCVIYREIIPNDKVCEMPLEKTCHQWEGQIWTIYTMYNVYNVTKTWTLVWTYWYEKALYLWDNIDKPFFFLIRKIGLEVIYQFWLSVSLSEPGRVMKVNTL